jgi:hypothetical protein
MSRRGPGFGYWFLTFVLIAFGIFAIASFGLPFLALGLVLLALAPKRRTPVVFWPVLTAVVLFLVTLVLMAPTSCQSVPQPVGEDGTAKAPLTACESLAGIPYGGSSLGDFLPAVMFGGTAAVPAAFGVRNLIRRREGVTATG